MTRVFWLAVIVVILSGVDAFATLEGISRGVYAEVNPFMEYLIDESHALFIIIKMGITTSACIVLSHLWHDDRTAIALGFGVGMYTIITITHVYGLLL